MLRMLYLSIIETANQGPGDSDLVQDYVLLVEREVLSGVR
jgi:hypothetical protein